MIEQILFAISIIIIILLLLWLFFPKKHKNQSHDEYHAYSRVDPDAYFAKKMLEREPGAMIVDSVPLPQTSARHYVEEQVHSTHRAGKIFAGAKSRHVAKKPKKTHGKKTKKK